MSMFSFHILFLYLLLQKMEDFCLFYALASMIFYSRSCIACNVFISDIFEMFYAFLCILCIIIQGTMVEQLCLNGFTLYKYICNKKKINLIRNTSSEITLLKLMSHLPGPTSSTRKYLYHFRGMLWTAKYIENNVCTRVTTCFSAHERVILMFISRVAKLRGK